MQAMVLSRRAPVESGPLKMEERPVPEAGPGEVLIRVKAAGVLRT